MLKRHLPDAGAFSRLVVSNLSAQAADQIGLAAAPIIAILLFQVGSETSFLLTLQSLPFLLLSPPADVLADRISRTRLMVCAEFARAAAMAITLLLLLTGSLTLPILAILGFIASTGTVVYNVTAPSLVPSLVPRERLSEANGNLEPYAASHIPAGRLSRGFS